MTEQRLMELWGDGTEFGMSPNMAGAMDNAFRCSSKRKRTPEFGEVFESLKLHGFEPFKWFVLTLGQLKLAYKALKNEFPTHRLMGLLRGNV